MNFKEMRQLNKMSRAELAKKLGISGQLIYRWETGTCEPQLVMLPKLAGIFGISIEAILRSFDKGKKNE